jgi:hypothetical protein
MLENRMVIGDYYLPGDDTDEEQDNRIADIEDELINNERPVLLELIRDDGSFSDFCVNTMLSGKTPDEKWSDIKDELNRQIATIAREREDNG